MSIFLLIITGMTSTASAYVVSEAGLSFIANDEGIVLNLYDDLGQGKGDCTIGVGHLVHTGVCKLDGSEPSEQEFRNGITKEQAIELLKANVATYEQDVNRDVTVPLTQNQFDALVDFTYNLGEGNLKELAKSLNAGHYDRVPQEMNLYVNTKTEKNVPGLVTRRSDEGALFQQPDHLDATALVPSASNLGGINFTSIKLCYISVNKDNFGGVNFDYLFKAHKAEGPNPRIDPINSTLISSKAFMTGLAVPDNKFWVNWTHGNRIESSTNSLVSQKLEGSCLKPTCR